MRQVSLQNKTLLKILSSLSNIVFEDPKTLKLFNQMSNYRPCDVIPEHDAYTHEYLLKALTFPIRDFQTPKSHRGNDISINKTRHWGNPELAAQAYDIIEEHNYRLQSFSGSHQNALFMYYPSNGFIGWHHNGNAPGYNAIFTYNTSDKGYFEWYNQKTNKFIKLPDNKGWNLRFGYYADQKTHPEEVFWHACRTETPRLTIAYVFYKRVMWENFIYECTGDDNFDAFSNIGIEDIKDTGN